MMAIIKKVRVTGAGESMEKKKFLFTIEGDADGLVENLQKTLECPQILNLKFQWNYNNPKLGMCLDEIKLGSQKVEWTMKMQMQIYVCVTYIHKYIYIEEFVNIL